MTFDTYLTFTMIINGLVQELAIQNDFCNLLCYKLKGKVSFKAQPCFILLEKFIKSQILVILAQLRNTSLQTKIWFSLNNCQSSISLFCVMAQNNSKEQQNLSTLNSLYSTPMFVGALKLGVSQKNVSCGTFELLIISYDRYAAQNI